VITRRRVVVSLLLAFAAAIMVYGFSGVRPEDTPVLYKNAAVIGVSPAEGATSVLRQSSVSVTLASGYELDTQTAFGMSISVEGSVTGIPEDQIQYISAENQYTFDPSAGEAYSELPLGKVCVDLVISKTANPNLSPTNFSWCFPTQ
jgi:hypothetical protein